MKALYVILIVATITFLAFTVTFAMEISSLPWSTGDYDLLRQKQEELHAVIKLFSLVYYGSSFFIFLLTLLTTGRQSGWKIVAIIAVVVSILMAIWSTMLGGAISFDEVFFVWLAAATLIGVLSFFGLCKSRSSGTMTQEGDITTSSRQVYEAGTAIDELERTGTKLIPCPVCFESTDSLKQYRLMYIMLFIGIVGWWRQRIYTACPSCMRKILLKNTFLTWNIILANLLWLILILPMNLILLIASTSQGHSQVIKDTFGTSENQANKVS